MATALLHLLLELYIVLCILHNDLRLSWLSNLGSECKSVTP